MEEWTYLPTYLLYRGGGKLLGHTGMHDNKGPDNAEFPIYICISIIIGTESDSVIHQLDGGFVLCDGCRRASCVNASFVS